jgi:hypothetical protein
MRANRIVIGLFLALSALIACDGTKALEWEGPDRVLEAVTPVSVIGVVGMEVDIAPVVRLTRMDGRPLHGVEVTFTASSDGDPRSATVMTSADGTASPGAWRLGTSSGLQTLTAKAAGRSVAFTADAQAGPTTTLTVIAGNGQRAAVGELLFEPLRVRATDDYGNVVTDEPITFAVVDGGGSLEPGASLTGADGVAESRWTLGEEPGMQHVEAATDGNIALFNAEACDRNQCGFEMAYVFENNIIVFDGATGRTRQLTSDGLSFDPAWSPDGERIAFVRHSVGEGIYVMNSDGSGVTRVTGAGSSWPTWSARGDALAFTSCPYECGLYVQELSVGSVARLTAAWGLDPAWSPDGSRIAYLEFHGELIQGDDTPFYSLQLVNADGTEVTEIVPVTPAQMNGPTWSPDGTRIAFSMNSDIYVVRADGTGLTRLTTRAFADNPAWSPDGTRIAYTNFGYDSGTAMPRIAAIAADGGEPVTLIASGSSPSWRPHR